MNQNALLFALAAIGRLEVLIQNGENAYNTLLQEHQAVVAERDALKKELEEAKKEKK